MGLKYQTNFRDIYDNRYRVEILDDNYHGASKDMELGGEGVTISRNGKKITEPIFSMGATIQVWCNEAFEYIDLFGTGEQTNQVVIGCNDQVIFRGWVEPNLYEEDYMAPPYLISIPASDGLASLENYYPAEMDGAWPYTLLSIIRRCLNCTGMNLPVNIACGLNPDKWTDNLLFERCCVETESLRSFKDGNYEYDDAAKLLEDILKPFSCRVYQSEDEWYIERIKDRVPQSVTWVRYTSDTTHTTIQKETGTPLDTRQFPFVDNAASLQVDAGYGKQTVKADGDTWDSVVINNFTDKMLSIPSDSDFKIYPFGIPNKIWFMFGNEFVASPLSERMIDIDQGVKIQHGKEANSKIRLWQTSKITASYQDEIKISFKLTIEPSRRITTTGRYKVRIQSKIRVADSNEYFTLRWEKGKNENTFYQADANDKEDFLSEAIYVKKDDWQDDFYKPIEVSLTARLDKQPGNYNFKDISFAILPVLAEKTKDVWVNDSSAIQSTIVGDITVKVNEKNKYDNTFVGSINRRQQRKAEDIDIRFWTLPSKYIVRHSGANYNFKNGLVYSDNSAVRYINCPGESVNTVQTSLPERLLIDNFDQYYDPRDLLTGTVQTDTYLSPERHYSIATRPDKAFLLTGLEANLKNAIYEINLEEIKPHQITANIR